MNIELDKIYCENCLDTLKRMPDGLLDCCVTSPPYWALRDYGDDSVLIWDGVAECEHQWQIEQTDRLNMAGGKSSDKLKIKGVDNFQNQVDYYNRKTESQFCQKCGAWRGALGLEPTFDLYISHLCDIFDEVRRAMKKTGTLWVNLGDTYGGSGNASGHTDQTKNLGYTTSEMGATKGHTQKLMPKSLIMIPFRFAIEMVNRGWILRNTIIWHKPNCMPSSASDRFTVDFEYLFFFTKSRKYWFEQQFEEHKEITLKRWAKGGENTFNTKYNKKNPNTSVGNLRNGSNPLNLMGRNQRTVWDISDDPVAIYGQLAKKINDFKDAHPEIDDGWLDDLIQEIYMDNFSSAVWNIPTKPFSEAHFAVYPEQLIETPIKAGCPEFVCKKCGKAREKIYQKTGNLIGMVGYGSKTAECQGVSPTSALLTKKVQEQEFVGYSDCGCQAGFDGGVVYDPFMGSGTTAAVALKQNKHFIGTEINGQYVPMAERRIEKAKKEYIKNLINNQIGIFN